MDLMTTAHAPPLRVVLADDSEDLLRMVRLRLETTAGVVIVGEATNGREAIEVVRDATPDLVVLDLAMPHLDGLQVAQELRHDREDLVLVALTGYTWDALGEQAEMAGFDHFLVKSDSLDELEQLVLSHREQPMTEAVASGVEANQQRGVV